MNNRNCKTPSGQKRMEMEMEDMAKKMQKELGIRSTEFKIG